MTSWQTFDLAGKPLEVFEPTTIRHALLFLHPVGQETLAHPSAEEWSPLLAERGFAVACPAGGYSWWADKIDPTYDPAITAEQYLLRHVVPWMQDRWAKPIAVAGISMGGQGALRLAFKYPTRFPVVGSIASAIEYHQFYGHGYSMDEMYTSKEQCRQDTAPMHLPPSNPPPHVYFCCDPDDELWHRGNDRLHEKMAALGAAHICDLMTRAGGHSWDYFNAMAGPMLDFLLRGLATEARRLV